MHTIWQGASNRLRERLGQVGFETWIAPLSLVGIEGQTATLQAPNGFFRDWVHDRYLNDLRQCLTAETGTDFEISLVPSLGRDDAKLVGLGPSSASAPWITFQSVEPTPAGHCRLDPRFTFDAFVVGPSNQLAHTAAMAVANQAGEKHNSLFLHGPVGLGKTHLATAMAHQLHLSDRGRRVLFAPAELFLSELLSCVRRDVMSEFRERMGRVDVLILDDVQFLSRRERIQEQFFHLFNSLQTEGRQIVLTSDQAPQDLTGLQEPLRSRFESGLITAIAPPDLKTRVAILHKKAAAENLTLSADVALFVAERVTSNVRELEGCLNRLAALASLTGGAITFDFAHESLRDLVHDGDVKLDIDTVQRHIAETFHIRLADLKSKKRTQHLAFCRQVAMYLCRKITDRSFPAIGAGFGRDHSTVIHAYNLIAQRVNGDAAFRGSIQRIERQLKSRSCRGT
jgi:chromosomal replication initiator protein